VHAAGSDFSLHMLDEPLQMQVVAIEAFQAGFFSWNEHVFRAMPLGAQKYSEGKDAKKDYFRDSSAFSVVLITPD